MPKEFVHLHSHSAFSVRDSVMKVEDYTEKVKNLGMKACALTDHGNLFGSVDFYLSAKENNINGIIGLEAYICRDMNLKGKVSKKKVKGEEENIEEVEDNKTYHLTLLARNNVGHKNLIKLISLANEKGFYYKPRIDRKLLAQYSEGLFCLSGCLSGEVPRLIVADKFDEAEDLIRKYLGLFGKYYRLEVGQHYIPEEEKVKTILQKLGKKYNIPLVATNDVHYLNREDSIVRDAIIAIRDHTLLSDSSLKKFDTDDFYVKSPDEMYSLFPENPEFCEETVKIADQCSVTIETGKAIFPPYEIKENISKEELITKFCREGWKSRIKGKISKEKEKEYVDRVSYELKVINDNKFTDYFLIVQDFCNFARSKNIPMSPGRGSVAGSLVAYLLNITDLDPIKYGLYFERFLNPERISPPDIDMDFADDRREEVIQYAKDKYGNKFGSVVTFGTYAPRKVIRDSFKVYGFDLAIQDQYAKLVPKVIQGVPEPKLKDVYRASKEISDLKEKYAEVFYLAEKLEGLPTQIGTHASAYILADKPLTEYVPMDLDTSDGSLRVGLDMYSAETLGLIKFDFLGIETLSIIQNAINLIKERHGVNLKKEDFPEEDEKTWKLIDKGDTIGIFQFESDGIRQLLKNALPKNLNELADCNGLYRPGAMAFIPEYCNVKHGRKEPEVLHPLLVDLLRETHSVLIFQESVMKMCQILGKFSLGEADIIRKAIGKKKKEEIEKGQEMFATKCRANGIEEALILKIVDWMTNMSRYSFNKSHSLAYSVNAFHASYLKAHYPFEFQIALLNKKVKDLSDYLTRFYDGKKRGIVVNGPDINLSLESCSAVDDKIYFGLGQIKGVSSAAIEKILEERNNGAFKNYEDFFLRCFRFIDKGTVEGLALTGALDSIGVNRKWVVNDNNLVRHLKFFAKVKQKPEDQIDMFGGKLEIDPNMFKVYGSDFLAEEKLAKEKEYLGFYVSGSPLEKYWKTLRSDEFSNSTKLTEENDGEINKLGMVISNTRIQKDKKGEDMCFLEANDEYGQIKGIVFSSNFNKNKRFLKEGTPVIAKGSISRNSILINSLEKLETVV